MSQDEKFFRELKERAFVGERTDRLEAELRAHLEDAGTTDAQASLGDPSEIARDFNRVRFERDGLVWVLSGLLLGAFALVLQLLSIWLISGLLSQLIERSTALPISFAPNPSEPSQLIVYLLAFPWIYFVFWQCARQAFRTLGRTPWSALLAAWLILAPMGANFFSRLFDPHANSQLPVDIVGMSFLILIGLVALAWIASRRNVSLRIPKKIRAALWIVLLVAIMYTSIAFGTHDGDGALAINMGLPRIFDVLPVIRELFESAIGSMLTLFLGFVLPPAMWTMIGATLSAWWIVSVIRVGKRIRDRKTTGFPWASIVALVYVMSILTLGAKDTPDVEFHMPVSSVSLQIEQSQMWLWPSLHKHFNRSNNVFPFYHTKWDTTREAYVVEQSYAQRGVNFLHPIDQWSVTPPRDARATEIHSTRVIISGPGGFGTSDVSPDVGATTSRTTDKTLVEPVEYGMLGPTSASITPLESDEDDVTLDELSAMGITCETDEPFPSCFRLSYEGKEIFSHATRSTTVTQAIVSPDKRWMLLTLTMRYSGTEYVYLVDLKN